MDASRCDGAADKSLDGNVSGPDQRMNLGAEEDDTGFATFELRRVNSESYTLDIPVYPGCNTLVKIDAD